MTARLRQESGNVDTMPKACHGRTLDEVVGLLTAKATTERSRIEGVLEDDRIRRAAAEYHDALVRSIDADDEQWKSLVPGKTLLAQFATATGVQGGRMKTST